MDKLKIKLIVLGGHSKVYDLNAIKKHKSNLFEISSVETISELPSMEGDAWHYTCGQLSEIVKNDSRSNFSIGLTEHMLDDNYYIRRLNNNACVISYYELIEVIQRHGNTVENFILRNIYELVSIYFERNSSLDCANRSFVHDDTRGCLYDLNGSKENIIYSIDSPIVCDQCTSRLKSKSLPHEFIDTLKKEIRKLRKPMYSRISDWIKQNPWKAFFSASFWAIFLNISASLFYDLSSKNFLQPNQTIERKKITSEEFAYVLGRISSEGVKKVLKLGDRTTFQGSFDVYLKETEELRDLGILVELSQEEMKIEGASDGKIVYGVKTTDFGKRFQSHLISTVENFAASFKKHETTR
jgi:hypothetical protein